MAMEINQSKIDSTDKNTNPLSEKKTLLTLRISQISYFYLQEMNLVIFTMVSSCARSYPTTTSFAIYLNRAIFIEDADIHGLIKGVIIAVFIIIAGLYALLYVLE